MRMYCSLISFGINSLRFILSILFILPRRRKPFAAILSIWRFFQTRDIEAAYYRLTPKVFLSLRIFRNKTLLHFMRQNHYNREGCFDVNVMSPSNQKETAGSHKGVRWKIWQINRKWTTLFRASCRRLTVVFSRRFRCRSLVFFICYS